MKDVLDMVQADAIKAEERKAVVRRELAPLMPYLDQLRAQGADVRIVWGANADGFKVGNVPPEWDAPFREGQP